MNRYFLVSMGAFQHKKNSHQFFLINNDHAPAKYALA